MLPLEKICLQVFLQRSYSVPAVTQSVPVIKLPRYIDKHMIKLKEKELKERNSIKRKILYRGNTSIPVISSTQKELNHYLGQMYNERYALPLLSKYWFKTKTSGQKFTISPWESNPSLPLPVDEAKKFDLPAYFSDFDLDSNILQSLSTLGLERPTPLQTLVIPKLLGNDHVLVAAETGSGKTVAYLAPILHHILRKKEKMQLHKSTPLGLIITPGRELAEQVADMAYKLGEASGIDVKVLVSGGTMHSHLKPSGYINIDLLVASVGTLGNLVKGGVYKLTNLQYVVLDEADTLLDDSFVEDTKNILKRLPVQTQFSKSDLNSEEWGTHLVFVSSIFPSNIHSIFDDSLKEENIVKIRSPYLHRVLPHVSQKFIRVSNDSRAGELLDLAKNDFQKKRPVLIFCNKSPACDWLSLFLKENGVPNAKIHGAVSPVKRSENWRAFQNGEVNVMCCTDLASRGLDTQWVKHVINFDFPNNVSDYILRAGRVGRVGSNMGKVTSFVVSPSGIYTVQEIEKAVRCATRIPDVDSNIKQKIKKLFFSP
ncbi:probable ATP-dependent RNA helicase DDX28 isoform X2 [Stegodyphus dumicola]|nr:probable ATP-dependent RNA helicase DDX28 isoform X2 [Stegodyphus dumicola]XP_035214730.1 probable ATP-dependent RNA helicase DDX28 isoform X2 [Stegodyphus dumicola]